MSNWGCAIAGCERQFDDLESLLAHQLADHDPHECQVCGELVPAGFFAIQHAFDEHSRAEYVRFYDANADDIRWREGVKDVVEARVDLDSLSEVESEDSDALRVEVLD